MLSGSCARATPSFVASWWWKVALALADAVVELGVDEKNVDKELVAALRGAGKSASRALDEGIQSGVKGTGTKAGKKIGDDLVTGMRGTGKEGGEQFKRDVNGKLRDSRGRFVNDGRKAGQAIGEGLGKGAGDGFSDSFQSALSFKAAGAAITSVFGPLRGLAGVLGFGVIAVQAAAAAVAVGKFAAALAPAAGILVALPAGIVLAGAAFGVLKIALSGVADIFGAALTGDIDAFNEAIKDAPAAVVGVAKELRALGPTLDGIKTRVQNGLFGPLQGEVTAIAAQLAGPLEAGLSSVAASMGLAAREATQFAQQGGNITFLNTVFSTLKTVIEALTPAIQPVLAGFRDIALVGLSSFPGMATSISDAAASFGNFLSQAVKSGQALGWIENAKVVLGQLGAVAQDVGGIFSGLFKAMSAGGGGNPLAGLGSVLDQLNEFANSPAGQGALTSVFTALAAVGQALGPVIKEIVTQLGGIGPVVADLATALGPVITTVVQALGDAIQGLGPGITDVVKELGVGFQNILPAIAPLASALGGVLSAVAPLLGPLGEIIGLIGVTLADAVVALTPTIKLLADEIGDHMAKILPELAPILKEVVKAFSDMLIATQPLISVLLNVYTAWLQFGILKVLLPLIRLWASAVKLAAEFVTDSVRAIKAFFSALSSLPDLFTSLISTIGSFVTGIVNFFTALPGQILSFLVGLPALVLGIFQSMMSFAYEALVTGVALLVQVFVSFSVRIIEVLAALPGQIVEFFTNLWTTVVEVTTTGVNAVVEFVTSLPGKIVEALSTLSATVAEIFTSMWNTAKETVTAGINAIVSLVAGLPDKIRGFVGSFIDAGKSLINGLMDGLQAISSGALSSLGSKIVDAVKSGINKGIGSINSFINDVNSKLPGSPIPTIPKLARGAIIDNGAMLAVIGEAGPEVVIPTGANLESRAVQLARDSGLVDILNRHGVLGTQSGKTQTINVYVTTAATDPDIVASKVASRLGMAW